MVWQAAVNPQIPAYQKYEKCEEGLLSSLFIIKNPHRGMGQTKVNDSIKGMMNDQIVLTQRIDRHERCLRQRHMLLVVSCSLNGKNWNMMPRPWNKFRVTDRFWGIFQVFISNQLLRGKSTKYSKETIWIISRQASENSTLGYRPAIKKQIP